MAQVARPVVADDFPIFTLDVKPMWAKIDVSLERAQQAAPLQLSASRFLMEFDLGMTWAPFRLQYALTTGMRPGYDQVIPSGIVNIGGVEFGEKRQANVGQAFQPASQKALNIGWSAGMSHRFQLTKFIDSHVQPVLIAELFDVRISAAEATDRQAGKPAPRQASETFRPFVWAAGGQYAYDGPSGILTATLAGSNKYSFAEIDYYYELNDWLALTLGWQHKSLAQDDSKLRANAWFAGVNLVW